MSDNLEKRTKIKAVDDALNRFEKRLIRGSNQDLVKAARTQKDWLQIKSPRDPRVLEALARVDRINFLPEEQKNRAYSDHPIGVSYPPHKSRTYCSMPSLIGLMSDMSDIAPGMSILEIGLGTGYHASVTSHLAHPGIVVSVEIDPIVFEDGVRNIRNHFGSQENIRPVLADGSEGYPQNGPYDRIYLTAAPDFTFDTSPFLRQLNQGGILLYPNRNGYLVWVRKTSAGLEKNEYRGVCFVNLQGKNT